MRVISLLVVVACARSPSTTVRVAPAMAMPFELTPATITFDPETPVEREALAVVNRYRAIAGVPTIGVDATLGAGCVEHASYLWINRGAPEASGLRAHDQLATLPGATPSGAACAKSAVIHFAAKTTEHAIDDWMATLYHRAPILMPYVDRIGIGASGSDRTMAVAMAFAVRRVEHAWPVAFPADGQHGVATRFVAEVPNPIPSERVAGYPFTLQFPPSDELVDVTATFVDRGGHAVPFYLSSPEHPAHRDHAQRGLVGVIPQRPLRAYTQYTVTVEATWRGRRGSWSSTFTTR